MPKAFDAADRLAQPLRDLIDEALQAAAEPERPTPRRLPGPREFPGCSWKILKPEPPVPHDAPHVGGQAPGDAIDEEIRREYKKRFGEPAPMVWGERRLISVTEA